MNNARGIDQKKKKKRQKRQTLKRNQLSKHILIMLLGHEMYDS